MRPVLLPADPAGGDDDEMSPYEISARSLERVILESQFARLNPRDRWLAAVATGADALAGHRPEQLDRYEPDDLDELREQAVSKLRHPSVARVWRHQPVARLER